jgi:hypothetical protein
LRLFEIVPDDHRFQFKVIHVGGPFCAADTTSDRAILAYNIKLKRTRNKSALRSFFVTSPVSGFQMG